MKHISHFSLLILFTASITIVNCHEVGVWEFDRKENGKGSRNCILKKHKNLMLLLFFVVI